MAWDDLVTGKEARGLGIQSLQLQQEVQSMKIMEMILKGEAMDWIWVVEELAMNSVRGKYRSQQLASWSPAELLLTGHMGLATGTTMYNTWNKHKKKLSLDRERVRCLRVPRKATSWWS